MSPLTVAPPAVKPDAVPVVAAGAVTGATGSVVSIFRIDGKSAATAE